MRGKNHEQLNGPLPGGFTLVEMLTVVAIVGILASMAIPLARLGEQRMKERSLREGLREIRLAIDNYKRAGDEGRILRKAGTSGYPESLEVLVSGVDGVATQSGRVYFLRRIPPDPFAPDDAASPGWGLRSYASPPTAPAAGDDVYDVYSLSGGMGSNGVAYRQW